MPISNVSASLDHYNHVKERPWNFSTYSGPLTGLIQQNYPIQTYFLMCYITEPFMGKSEKKLNTNILGFSFIDLSYFQTEIMQENILKA